MKNNILSYLFIILPTIVTGQFEQKVSLNIEGGIFKTIGSRDYSPEWANDPEYFEPSQMVNYRPGIYGGSGLQYNWNRNFSVSTDIGIMYAGKWFYPAYDNVSYFAFCIHDTITDELLAEGANELDFFNFHIGLTPKFYLSPEKKWNPYVYTGITINYSSSTFVDNQWEAYRELEMLEPWDTSPSNPYLESNTGVGFNPGFGMEYSFSDKTGLYITAGYHFILLDKENFKSIEQNENFHALSIKAGLRFSFFKSKDY